MALEVIGAGFGRTGTLSLKLALERLGFEKCYHMLEVLQTPGASEQWADAAEGRAMDWDAVFDGYRAAVDWPVCAFWRELSRHYPRAKVILTVRDPGEWYESVYHTIYQTMRAEPPPDRPDLAVHRAMVQRLILEQTFDNRFEDRAHAIEVYERHNRAVREALPPERLLVYRPGEGWEPLCAFLGLPVPEEPYPRVNSREEFQQRVADMTGSERES